MMKKSFYDALDEVCEEIMAMDKDEFVKELKKREDSPIAKMLIDSGMFDQPAFTNDYFPVTEDHKIIGPADKPTF